MDKKNLRILEVITKYSEFLTNFMKITKGRSSEELTLWEKIKVFYYIFFKYKIIYKKIMDCIEDDAVRIAQTPENLVELMTSYLYVIDKASSSYKDPNEFIKAVTNVPITIQVVTDANNVLQKYKVSIFDKSILNRWFRGKVCRGTLDIDINKAIYELDMTVYDTEDENNENLINTNVLYKKLFKIQPDGTIYNSNYALDKSLEMKENADYARSGLFMFRPFANMIIYFTSLQFIGVKTKEG